MIIQETPPAARSFVTFHNRKFNTGELSYDPAHFETAVRYSSGNTIQIILKVSERCNIACSYCYFFFGGDESYKDNPAYIERSTIDALAAFIAHATDKYNLRRVSLIIHGGEPLMLKLPHMRHLFSKVREACGSASFRPTVQTNAMLVDEAWVDLFSEYKCYVGVSLDGPAELNDRYRVDKRGRGTYDRTLKGVEKLFNGFRAGAMARPGLLCVLNPTCSATELYRHFVDEIGFYNIDFLLPIADHDEFDCSLSSRLADLMAELFQLYKNEPRKEVQIRFFDKVIKSLGYSPFVFSTLSRFSAQKDIVFVVSSAGDIGPDDTLRVNSPALMTTGLNVKTSTLTDVLLHPKLNFLVDQSFKIPAACTSCDFAQACRGGELYHRYSAKDGFDRPSVHCETLMRIHTDVAEMMLSKDISGTVIEERLLAQLAPFL